ncbi:MAG: hypothetical protein FJZ01_02055 [Candidatus Sericytochromatia bacterium]|nr:hypothetical protein [Candidatus Tanganyikabacteria bacterium]
MRIDKLNHEPPGKALGWERRAAHKAPPGQPATAPPASTPPGTTPTGTAPTGTAPTGTNPSGTPPTGTAPTGTAPAGTNATGTNPTGTVPGTIPTGTAPGSTGPAGTTPPPPPTTGDPAAADALASVSNAMSQVLQTNSTLAALLANRPTFNTTFSGTLSHPVGTSGHRTPDPSRGLDADLLRGLRSPTDATAAQAGLEAVLGTMGYGLTDGEKAAFNAIQQLEAPLLGTAFDYRTFLPR